jgi:hypothetical protein
MIETILPPNAPTFLQWVPDETGRLRAVFTPLPLCPQCGDPCGHLYRDTDTPEGVCLSCKVGWEDAAIADYEAFEAATYGAETACSCGID